MSKLLKYKNKFKLEFYSVEDILDKYTPSELYGKRILAIQKNDFITGGKFIYHPEHLLFLNYTNRKIESLEYLLNTKKEYYDLDKYEYEEFKKTIETETSQYESINMLHADSFKGILILDDYNIVIDAEDKPFAEKTINMLTFDPKIDYYTNSRILALQDDTTNLNEITLLQHYPKKLFQDEHHFIELKGYTFEEIKYLNYFYNAEIIYK